MLSKALDWRNFAVTSSSQPSNNPELQGQIDAFFLAVSNNELDTVTRLLETFQTQGLSLKSFFDARNTQKKSILDIALENAKNGNIQASYIAQSLVRAGATKPKVYFSFIYLHNLTLLWDEHWSKNKNEILSSIEWKDIVILATRKKDTDVLNAFIESNKILDENCLIEMVSNDLTTQFNNYCIKHKPLLTQACLQKLVLASIKNNNQNLLCNLMRMPILKNDSAFINQALIESITANNQTATDIILRSLPSLSLIKWHELIPHIPSVNMLHYLARFGDCKQALINHIDKIYDLFTHE